ncbi:hypothetical protein BCU70_12965 [Vibrio sp. 10N.286.49.C2]|uniref:hypothetical protein n=1 Tax=unclassified Vibrio TaxID=2614977 RepID=UPI000C841E3C|nr:MULTISPECIES: hypothetical protein [unclassified Vibrio]PMH39292.1 hypothetical protein BCU70_12965 [Vibrio sp. 10N.286.49.C2]PMH54360.1 hypothetical protein BCU66_12000 [Vibrio sp. 10N.286.49.B1]PMH78469.1 hypothetical protein BCU58_00880 [Vibrio sp. 10N.286.48.B7]
MSLATPFLFSGSDARIIDHSHALALVKGFKRKNSDRISRRPKSLGLTNHELKTPTKKTLSKLMNHFTYMQRVIGNTVKPPTIISNAMSAYSVVVDNDRLKLGRFQYCNGGISFGVTGLIISDHSIARFLQRERTNDVGMAVRLLGREVYEVSVLIDAEIQKTNQYPIPEQNIEVSCSFGGVVFIEINNIKPGKSAQYFDMILKTYISTREMDARNGIRAVAFADLVY